MPGLAGQRARAAPHGDARTSSGPALPTSPVAIVLSRLRADPSEPVRADPEPAIQRRARAAERRPRSSVSGTARLRPNADDPTTDRLVATTGPVVRSSQDLPGDLGARASAALDGRTGTAWSTPFVGLTGQWWEVDTGKETTVSAFGLDIVADAHHSVPDLDRPVRRRRTRAGARPAPAPVGGPRRHPPGQPGPAAASVTGRTIRLTIDGARPRTTPDWYSGQPGRPPHRHRRGPPPRRRHHQGRRAVDTGCRDDLLAVDGRPVPLRITGTTTAALARDGLAVRTCSGAPHRPHPRPARPARHARRPRPASTSTASSSRPRPGRPRPPARRPRHPP